MTRPNSRPALRQILARAGACMLLVLAAGMAQASPQTLSQDPVTQLLVDRGLLGADSPGLVNTLRDKASDMVMSAMHFLGVPYRRGGDSADEGFDCSGFTRHVFENSLGLVLPRRADEQAKAGNLFKVNRDDLKPGDLVFFNTMRRTFSHVGIYVGEGKFIHAPRTGAKVRVEDMRQAYWERRFTGARRAAAAAEVTSPSVSEAPRGLGLAP